MRVPTAQEDQIKHECKLRSMTNKEEEPVKQSATFRQLLEKKAAQDIAQIQNYRNQSRKHNRK